MRDPERRYQRWLRLYPKGYRAVRGDEIVATLLDSAAEPDHRIASRDLLHLVIHAIRVRISQIGTGPVRRPLPQPVRLVTWILVGSAVASWVNAVLDHGYPKHPGANPSPGPVVVGFIFLGLNFLIQARRRILYMIVIGILVAFLASGVSRTGLSGAGAILEVPYFLFVLFLMVGWRRYMDVIADDGASPESGGKLDPRR